MTKMSKRLAASVAATLIATSMIQTATAAERTTKHRLAATTNEAVRNANAFAMPYYLDQDEVERLRNGAMSAPAGR